MSRIVVVGASGFVGSAVVSDLRDHGHEVVTLRAPRLPPVDVTDVRRMILGSPLDALMTSVEGADAVVNAAGDPDASSLDERALTAANAGVPGLLAYAVSSCPEPPRFVHVSSVVVQGRMNPLDESATTAPHSAYARSKALGERLVEELGGGAGVSYRPPGVHHETRRLTRSLARLSRTPLSSVAAPADAPSPQALLGNVASAISFLATTPSTPPSIVLHPWEGLTTAELLTTLSGRRPVVLPRPLAGGLVRAVRGAGAAVPALAANARRLEMLWFGQQQTASWLTREGWCPPFGLLEWDELASRLHHDRPA